MKVCSWISGASIAVVSLLLSSSEASAQGIPVLGTWGETISHVGSSAPEKVGYKPAVMVGYKYSYIGVFWIDLWTWGGTYCVYEGKRYQPITADDAATLLGEQESALSPPFLYKCLRI